MKKLLLIFACIWSSAYACDKSYLSMDSLRLDTGNQYIVYFKGCIGGGADSIDPISWAYGADARTINFGFFVYGSVGLNVAHTHANPYPARIPSPVAQSAGLGGNCSNCIRAKAYGSNHNYYVDLPATSDNCPYLKTGQCATVTGAGLKDCVFYTANDSTETGTAGSCWGAFTAQATNGCLSTERCQNKYPEGVAGSTKRRPAFSDIWRGSGQRKSYCFNMYIRTNGRPDSIEWTNVEQINGRSNPCNVPSSSDPLLTDETIYLSSWPLPIQWIDFYGNADKDAIKLEWDVAIEDASSYYIVYKSVDGIKFDVIGTINSWAKKEGKSHYIFIDPSPINGKQYYRLKQTDFDGYSIANPNTIEVEYNGPTISSIISVNPFPATDFVDVAFYTSDVAQWSVIISNSEGKIIDSMNKVFVSGKNILSIDLTSYKAGLYYITLISNKQKLTGKFIHI